MLGGDPDIVEAGRTILMKEGYTVAMAHDVRDVVALIDHFRPELLFVDVIGHEPADGVSAGAEVRRAGLRVPILIMATVGRHIEFFTLRGGRHGRTCARFPGEAHGSRGAHQHGALRPFAAGRSAGRLTVAARCGRSRGRPLQVAYPPLGTLLVVSTVARRRKTVQRKTIAMNRTFSKRFMIPDGRGCRPRRFGPRRVRRADRHDHRGGRKPREARRQSPWPP